MTLSISPKAARDPEHIGDDIARDNPRRAISFIGELRHLCQAIAAHPEAFPARPHLAPNIRRATHGRYLIFYSIMPGSVRIERILHGAREISPDTLRS